MKYREVARKLLALGCQELPRQGGGSTGSGSIPNCSRCPCYLIGAVVISSLEPSELRFGSSASIGMISKAGDLGLPTTRLGFVASRPRLAAYGCFPKVSEIFRRSKVQSIRCSAGRASRALLD